MPESVEDHLALAPVALAVAHGPSHAILYANAPFRRLLSANEIALGGAAKDRSRSTADLTGLLDQVLRTADALYDELLPTGDGLSRWRCTIWPVRNGNAPTELVIEVRDVADAERVTVQRRAIAERLLLGALRDQEAARDAQGTSRRALHLADVSRELSLSLDEEATRETIRRVTPPRPGTWCIVDVVESDGSIVRLPPIHPDPSKQALALRLADRSPSRVRGNGALGTVLASARPMVLTPEAGSALTAVMHGEENLSTLREIGFDALLVAPLVVRARVEGAITVVSPKGGGAFSDEETALVTDVAARCALALDNARLYREADTLRRAADLANEAKTQFLGNMSHELRTPLNAIAGFVELIDIGIPGPVNEQQHSALARIKANQELLLALITEILNFAKIESGRIEYRTAAVPMLQALTDVSEMLSVAIHDKELALDGPRGDPTVTAWADPDRVRQIIVNLVMNAVKYTNKGGTISLECSAEGDRAIVRVSDTGPGIEPAKLDTIFEPFIRLTPGLADYQGGVGLGLTISRDLARGMAGDLIVESTIGVGSRFTLSLPLYAPKHRRTAPERLA
jgi:signal transduction histidine kinase